MAGSNVSLRITGDVTGLTNALKQAGVAVQAFDRKAQGASGSIMKNILGMAGLPATTGDLAVEAGRRVLQFGMESAQAAMQVEQAMMSLESVFGKAASKVDEFGKTSAEAYGLSRREVLQIVPPIGQLLRGLGFTEEQAATAAIQIGKLGADLAAAFPASGGAAQAVQALGAALRGEYDPAERFGIGLSETTVKAKMLEMGFKTLTGEINLNERAQAVLALMTERTAKVQGQFDKVAETAAGKLKILTAQFDDMKIAVGEELLEGIGNTSESLSDQMDQLERTAVAWADFGGEALEALANIIRLGGGVEQTINEIGTAILETKGFGNKDQTLDEFLFGGMDEGQASATKKMVKGMLTFDYLEASTGALEGFNQSWSDLMDELEKRKPKPPDLTGFSGIDPDTSPAALEMNAKALSEVDKKARDAARALNDAAEAILRLQDARDDTQRGWLAYEDSLDDVVEAVERAKEAEIEYGAGSREHLAALREITRANMDAVQSAVAIAEAQVAVAEAEAEAAGKTFEGNERRAEMIYQLGILLPQIKDPTVKKAIEDRIEKLRFETLMYEEAARAAKLYADGLAYIPRYTRVTTLTPDAIEGLLAGGMTMPEIEAMMAARADGGPVSTNQPYLVGERGPEVFVPNKNGTIIPNHALGGGGGVTINVGHYYGPPDQFVSDMSEALRRLEAARR